MGLGLRTNGIEKEIVGTGGMAIFSVVADEV
jgi:hypothetical protein